MNKIIRNFVVLFFVIAFACGLSSVSNAEEVSKLLLISSDSIKVSDVADVKSEAPDISAGLLSLKTMNRNEENIFINMAYGRTYKYSGENLKSIVYGRSSSAKDYSKMMKELESEYSETNNEVKSIGDILKDKRIARSYIGGLSKSYILLADSEGSYDYVNELKSDNIKESDIVYAVEEEFSKSDIVMLSLKDIENSIQKKAVSSLMSKYKSILVSTERTDYGYLKNNTVSLILKSDFDVEPGLLTSESTKRRGLVSSLDIKTTILDSYGIMEENGSGKIIESSETDREFQEILVENLSSYSNLNFVKYIYHGIIIFINLLVIILSLIRRNSLDNKIKLYCMPLLFVMFSIMLSPLLKSEALYAVVIMVISLSFLTLYVKKGWDRNYIMYISLITNILILVGVFFAKDMIYDSFIGYNNIDAGGRYYGFNNDIMGVLLATGIVSAVLINSKFRFIAAKYLGLLFLTINLISLTGNYGSNFGGMLTAIIATVLYLYYFTFKNTSGLKKLLVLVFAVAIAMIVFSIAGGTKSHFSEFFNRVSELGFVEFFDMIKKKVYQLVYITIMPPWSIIVIMQSVYIIKKLMENKYNKEIKLLKLIFYTSIGALILNDTGAIAFMYMNVYTIAFIRYYEERGYFADGN